MTTFLYRLMGAAMLDGGTYEQIEADRPHGWQSLFVVLLASAAAGVGVRMEVWAGAEGFVRAAGLSLIVWVAWALLALQIGVFVLPEAETQSDIGEMLRTLGFAAAPGILQIFGAIPGLRGPVFTLTWIWMFIAMVVALRHALDYRSAGRALAVCAAAAAIVLAFVFSYSLIFNPSVS